MPDTPDAPEAKPEELKNELYCFFDFSRPCTCECVAWEAVVPEDKDYKDKPWAHCMIAVNVHRVGKHLVVLGSGLGKIVNLFTDQTRTNPKPPTSLR